MSHKQAAPFGSISGHGTVATAGYARVMIEKRPAVRVDDTFTCPKHGPATVASGRGDVIVGGKALARLHDCIQCASYGDEVEPLVDHGTPYVVIDDIETHIEGDWASYPKEELKAVLEALRAEDPIAIKKAVESLPKDAKLGQLKVKVVDRQHEDYPNTWREYEITGPGGVAGGTLDDPAGPKIKIDADGLDISGGGTVQGVGAKGKAVHRSRNDEGKIVEWYGHLTKSHGKGNYGRLRIGPKGVEVEVDLEKGGIGGGRKILTDEEAGVPGAGGGRPAADMIVSNTASTVLVGAG